MIHQKCLSKTAVFTLLLLSLLLAACNSTPTLPLAAPTLDTARLTLEATRIPAERYADYEIVTLLPRDGIPAIDDPQFVTVDQADRTYADDELVMGVVFNGDARAYSIPLLSRHEIVNDTVGGVNIAVTW